MNVTRWNYGWFGAQLGGTVWMLALAITSPPLWSLVPVAGVVVFVLINMVGLIMWKNQADLDEQICLQVLIAVLALGTFCLLALMDASACLQKWDPRIQNPKTTYLLLLIFPVVSIWIRVMNKRNAQQ